MKKATLLLSLLLCISVVSCVETDINNNTEDKTEPSTSISREAKTEIVTDARTTTESLKLFQFDETDIPVLDESDYIIDDNTLITDELLIYKPVVDISEAYPDFAYEEISFPEGFSPIHCDNNGIWYDSLYKSYGVGGNGKIVSYNPETAELSDIISPEGDTACSCLLIQGEYMVWKESINLHWINTSYYLYNLSTGENKKFYEAAINPETNCSYLTFHFNQPVIIDNKIYFDDVVGIYEDNTEHKIVYSYDIIEDKWEKLYDDAVRPVEYIGKIAWFSKSNENYDGVFCNSDGAIYKASTRLGASPNAYGDISFINDFLSKNDFLSIKNKQEIKKDNFDQNDMLDVGRSSYGIKIFKDGKAEPIILSGSIDTSYVSNLEANDRFLTWCGDKVGKPILYDIEKDVIINMDFIDNSDIRTYDFIFYNDKLLLSYSNFDFEVKHYLISL